MNANPLWGVFLCWLGGLASASFYVPFRKVRGWSWETYWLANGIVSWIAMPWLLAWLLTNNLLKVFHSAPASTVLWTYFFGVLWGVGGLTFGLTMRYLGMSLGMAVAMGNCAVFGTLIPPIFHGQFSQLLLQRSGIVTLAVWAHAQLAFSWRVRPASPRKMRLLQSRRPPAFASST